jgi:hypothetical protein
MPLSFAEEMATSTLKGMALGLCNGSTTTGALFNVVEGGKSALVISARRCRGRRGRIGEVHQRPRFAHRLGNSAQKEYLKRYGITEYPSGLMEAYINADAKNR